MAKLYFRYGAMNSGKTTLLLQTAHNYEESNMKVIIVKPKVDTKGKEKIVSRIGVERKVDLILKENDNLFEIVKKKYKDVSCVLVDEAQFLTEEQVDSAMNVVLDLDIPVICYGLRTDFKMQGFEGSKRLLLLAHSIEEMKTICKCGRKAVLNGRKINGKFVFEGEQVAIDLVDNVEYESLCGHCYIKYKNQK